MKRLLIILAVLVLAVVLVAAGALFMVDANRFRPQIQASLSQAMGRPVTLGKLHVSVFSGSLDADDIRIGDDPAFGKQPFIQARSLDVGVRLWPLIVHRELHVTSLTLDAPSVRLVQNRAGHWNFSSFAAADSGRTPSPADSSAPALTVDALRIRNGRIVLHRAVGGTRTYDKVDLSADHLGTRAAFPFTMSASVPGGGSIKLDGSFGPLDAGNAIRSPLTAHLLMNGIDLVRAGLVSHAQGISGVIALDSRIRSQDGVLHSQGRIDARHLQLVASGSPAPQPIRLDYKADYNLSSSRGRIHGTRLGTGKASLAVHGSFDGRGAVMRLNLAIAGRKLPVDDLQPLLPAFGVILPKDSQLRGGTLGVDLRARGPLDRLVISGPVTLDNTTLAGYSLGDKLGGALSLVGVKAPRDTQIEHAEATLRIAPSGIRANPAKADVKGLGTMSGKGNMAASGALDFNMLVKLDKSLSSSVSSSKALSGSKAGRLLGGLLGGTSQSGIGVHVGGTASDPKFRLDPRAAADLLRSGFGGSSSSKKTSSGTQKKSPSTRDTITNLLQNALDKKQKQN
jgi:AsmA protein